MRSCERPLKRSARDAVPSSVSKRYSLSIRTQGSSCRRCASSSPRRVRAFSASSSSSRAASHSSRVPILWSVIAFSYLWLQQVGVARTTDDVCHRWRESGKRRGRDDDQDSKSDDRRRLRDMGGALREDTLLSEDENGKDD